MRSKTARGSEAEASAQRFRGRRQRFQLEDSTGYTWYVYDVTAFFLSLQEVVIAQRRKSKIGGTQTLKTPSMRVQHHVHESTHSAQATKRLRDGISVLNDGSLSRTPNGLTSMKCSLLIKKKAKTRPHVISSKKTRSLAQIRPQGSTAADERNMFGCCKPKVVRGTCA